MKEKMTVKEWAKKAGLVMYNYDGFVPQYEKLANIGESNFNTFLSSRFRDAKDLYCTRKGFEAGINKCTIKLPSFNELSMMVNIIPEFVESWSNMQLGSIILDLKNEKLEQLEKEKLIDQLSNILHLKEQARKKSIELSNFKCKKFLDVIPYEFDKEILSNIKNYSGTIEDIEENLIKSLNKYISILKNKKNIRVSDMPIEELKLLITLSCYTSRTEYSEEDKEYIYVKNPASKEDLIIPFNIIDGDGRKYGVSFDINGTKGTLPTTAEINEKIENYLKK